MALRQHAVVLLQSALLFANLVLIGIPVRFGFIFGGGSCGGDDNNDWWWQNPTWWWSRSNDGEESSQLPAAAASACCCRELFTDGTTSCTVAELMGIRDYGYRFGLHYQLCWIVWLVVTFMTPNKQRVRLYSTTASASMVYFHKVLIVCSSSTMVLLAWLQNYFVAVDDDGETSLPSSARRTATTKSADDDVLNDDFVSSMYFYHLLAISVSIGAILFNDQQQQQQQQQHLAVERERQNHVEHRNGNGGHAVAAVAGRAPEPVARRPPSQVKWSIPANSIWFGAIINTLIAVASLQLLLDRGQYYYGVGGLERYYRNNDDNDIGGSDNNNNVVVTPAVRYGFAFATFCTALHATILFQIRNILCSTRQLRTICLYKFVSSALLQQPWLPPSRVINADTRWILAIRVALTVSYLNGFLWAGKAEGIGRILNSEKED